MVMTFKAILNKSIISLAVDPGNSEIIINGDFNFGVLNSQTK